MSDVSRETPSAPRRRGCSPRGWRRPAVRRLARHRRGGPGPDRPPGGSTTLVAAPAQLRGAHRAAPPGRHGVRRRLGSRPARGGDGDRPTRHGGHPGGAPAPSVQVPRGGRGRPGAEPGRGGPGPGGRAARPAHLRRRHLASRGPAQPAGGVVDAAGRSARGAAGHEGRLRAGGDRGGRRRVGEAAVRDARGPLRGGGRPGGDHDRGPGGLGRSDQGRLARWRLRRAHAVPVAGPEPRSSEALASCGTTSRQGTSGGAA